MKKIFFGTCLLLAVGFSACKPDGALTPEELDAKVNTLAASKIEAINAQATTDCEARMATEVKALSDSLMKSNK